MKVPVKLITTDKTVHRFEVSSSSVYGHMWYKAELTDSPANKELTEFGCPLSSILFWYEKPVPIPEEPEIEEVIEKEELHKWMEKEPQLEMC